MTEPGLSPIQQIIADAARGRPYVLVDTSAEGSHGDLVISAQHASPDAINDMAMHARGLIQLAISPERARALRLSPMRSRLQVAPERDFTVSIEARVGVTTGISAHDRARTIAVAIDPEARAEDLVSPGHVFPIVTQDGGVLRRPCRPEAAVDVARAAKQIPAAVVCQILNEDGSVSQLHELIAFAQRRQMRVGSVADLVAYRRGSERLIERTYDGPFSSRGTGDCRVVVYKEVLSGAEHLAFIRGGIAPRSVKVVGVHHLNLLSDALGWGAVTDSNLSDLLQAFRRQIEPAVLVLLREPDELAGRMLTGFGSSSVRPMQATAHVPAQILEDLGVGCRARLLAGEPDALQDQLIAAQ